MAEGEGAWRFHYSTEKQGEQFIIRRLPEALLMSEALTRALPADDDERAVFVALFQAIERGATHGAQVGRESADDRQAEEGGDIG